MVDMEVSGRRPLVLMAGQAVDSSLVGITDNHLYRGDSKLGHRIDVALGVMAGAAAINPNGMLGQDLHKGTDDMAIRTRLRVGLTAVGSRVELDGMIEGAASYAMVMALEIGAVATAAVAAGRGCRGNQDTIGG